MSSQRSAIFKLPDDLLEIVFVACIHAFDGYYSISPLTLSQICQRWRTIAHESARLWTRVDLAYPERAKHFVQLSNDAGLHVRWVNRYRRTHSMRSRDWLWQHARRFVTFDLKGDSWFVQAVLGCVGRELPMLQHATIEASLVLVTHISLSFKFPKLVSLTLKEMKTSVQDLTFTLRNAPQLQELHLTHLNLTGLDRAENSSSAGRTARRPRLLALTSMPVDAQPFILSALHHRPTIINILGCVTDANATWSDILHPVVAARFDPMRFTILCLHPTYLELRTDADAIEHHASLSLGAFGFNYVNLLSKDTNLFDLSQFHTLELDQTPPVALKEWLPYLRRFAITKVVARRSWPECSGTLIATLPHLRELHIVASDLHNFGTRTRYAEALISGLRQRRELQVDGVILPPLERMVLERCSGLGGNIELLRREVEVMVIT